VECITLLFRNRVIHSGIQEEQMFCLLMGTYHLVKKANLAPIAATPGNLKEQSGKMEGMSNKTWRNF